MELEDLFLLVYLFLGSTSCTAILPGRALRIHTLGGKSRALVHAKPILNLPAETCLSHLEAWRIGHTRQC